MADENLQKELKEKEDEIERLKKVEEDALDLQNQLEDAKTEAEKIKEESEADAEELRKYRETGQTVEEQNEVRVKEAEDKAKASDLARRNAEETLAAREKGIKIEKARAKIRSEFPEVVPSWIVGETEEEMRKSAEESKKNLEGYYENKKKSETEIKRKEWEEGPQPGGGPVSPASGEQLDDEHKKIQEEGSKANVGDLIGNIINRAKKQVQK